MTHNFYKISSGPPDLKFKKSSLYLGFFSFLHIVQPSTDLKKNILIIKKRSLFIRLQSQLADCVYVINK